MLRYSTKALYFVFCPPSSFSPPPPPVCSRIYAALIAGIVAGILGVTGYKGFLVFVTFQLLVSVHSDYFFNASFFACLPPPPPCSPTLSPPAERRVDACEVRLQHQKVLGQHVSWPIYSFWLPSSSPSPSFLKPFRRSAPPSLQALPAPLGPLLPSGAPDLCALLDAVQQPCVPILNHLRRIKPRIRLILKSAVQEQFISLGKGGGDDGDAERT